MPGGSVEYGAAARKAAALLIFLLAAGLTGCGNPLLKGGSLHFEAGRFERAAEVFQQAIAKDPSDPEPHLWLARSWSELGRVSDALAEYDRTLGLSRSMKSAVSGYRLHYWRIQEARGEGFLREAEAMKAGAARTERLKQAADALDAAAAYGPDKAITDYEFSLLHKMRGENDKSRDALESAFRKAESDRESIPTLLPVLRKEGEAAVMANHYADALAIYEHAARLAPADPNALGDLATAYLLMAEDSGAPSSGRPTAYLEAARLLERVRKMRPDDPDALYNLATVRSRLGQSASADSVLRAYMALKPRDPDGYALFEEVATALNRPDEARTADLAAQALSESQPVQSPAEWARGAQDKFGSTSAVGRAFAEFGVPDEIRTVKTKNGDLVEIWFYFARGRVAAFQKGVPAGAFLRFGRL